MSYVTPQYTPPSEQPQRPSTVTTASLSLYAMALLSLITVVLGVISVSSIDAQTVADIYVLAGMDKAAADTAGALAVAVMYVSVGISFILGAIYLVLGMFVAKGKNWARITAWVFGGLAICCNAISAAGTAASGALGGGPSTGGVDAELVEEKLAALTPSWIGSASTALSIITLLLALAAVITLALPASNAFFRRPEPEWIPPSGPAV